MSVVVVGSVNIDRIIDVSRIPRAGETVNAISLRVAGGGKGANQAYYAIRTSRASGSVALIARIGEDTLGREVVESLAREGVDISGVRAVHAADTGEAYIFVDPDGENQIAVMAAANHRWDTAPLALQLTPDDVIVLQAEIPLAVIAEAARSAHRAGARVVLNAAPYIPGILDVLATGDVLVVNETEATEAFDRGSPEGVVAGLSADTAYHVVVTLGENGALVSRPPHKNPDRVPAFAADVHDSVGAGDAFVGSLAVALDEGSSLAAAVLLAAATASIAVRTPGAQSPLVTRARVDAVLRGVAAC